MGDVGEVGANGDERVCHKVAKVDDAASHSGNYTDILDPCGFHGNGLPSDIIILSVQE